jgi:putative redox protein
VPSTRAVRLDWIGEGLRFRANGTEPAAPTVEIDPDSQTGPSPMLALLMAAGGCTGADVVAILEKMKVGLESLSIDVVGTRRDEHPKCYSGVKFRFRMSGNELELSKAERAVQLSLEKYCSVVHSLAPHIDVEHEIELA